MSVENIFVFLPSLLQGFSTWCFVKKTFAYIACVLFPFSLVLANSQPTASAPLLYDNYLK